MQYMGGLQMYIEKRYNNLVAFVISHEFTPGSRHFTIIVNSMYVVNSRSELFHDERLFLIFTVIYCNIIMKCLLTNKGIIVCHVCDIQ